MRGWLLLLLKKSKLKSVVIIRACSCWALFVATLTNTTHMCVWEREKGCVCLSGFLHHSFSLKLSTGLSELKQMLVVNNKILKELLSTLQWRHNERDGVSNHQPHGCLLQRLFRCRSKKTSKLRVTGLYEGSSPVTGEFPTQRASNAENVSIWWRHHEP